MADGFSADTLLNRRLAHDKRFPLLSGDTHTADIDAICLMVGNGHSIITAVR